MTEFCFFDKDARKELKSRNIYVPDVYRNVRSSCNNNDNLQGVAIAPSTGKLQYYYRKQFIELKREETFRRINTFVKKAPKIRKDAKILLQLGTLREKKIALAIMLADACSFRVGNRKNKNPGGITTLKKTHFSKDSSISFIGKAGKLNTCTKKFNVPESLLKKYFSKPPSAKSLNDFLSRYGPYTIKDFRTLNANIIYVSNLMLNQKIHTSKKKISAISLRQTATEMNNTVPTLKKHYLHPEIEAFYLHGREPLTLTGKKSSQQILQRFLSIVCSSALSSPAS